MKLDYLNSKRDYFTGSKPATIKSRRIVKASDDEVLVSNRQTADINSFPFFSIEK